MVPSLKTMPTDPAPLRAKPMFEIEPVFFASHAPDPFGGYAAIGPFCGARLQ